MKTLSISETTLERLIEGLEDALNVCYNVDETDGKCERTYPYAVGYSRGVMESILTDLNHLKSQAN